MRMLNNRIYLSTLAFYFIFRVRRESSLERVHIRQQVCWRGVSHWNRTTVRVTCERRDNCMVLGFISLPHATFVSLCSLPWRATQTMCVCVCSNEFSFCIKSKYSLAVVVFSSSSSCCCLFSLSRTQCDYEWVCKRERERERVEQ
jgi:hypothetical protein